MAPLQKRLNFWRKLIAQKTVAELEQEFIDFDNLAVQATTDGAMLQNVTAAANAAIAAAQQNLTDTTTQQNAAVATATQTAAALQKAKDDAFAAYVQDLKDSFQES